jgi:hypothetical protein
MKYEIIKNYKEAEFKVVTGVLPATFEAMLARLREAYAQAHKNRGRHRKLSLEDMLLMTLEYYREYRTLDCIGASYGLKKTNVGKGIKWVETVLIRSDLFHIPGKNKLVSAKPEIEVIVVDTTETPIQRPKSKQKKYYSGKKNGTP